MPANNQNHLIPKGFREAKIGAAFRAARESKKIALRTLAPALGLSINTIRWHEAGVRLMRTEAVGKAAEIIGVPVSDLFETPRLEPKTPIRQKTKSIKGGENAS